MHTADMYAYRKMSKEEREDACRLRTLCGTPLHAPPHFSAGPATYLLTAANFEHAPIMETNQRRQSFLQQLLQHLTDKAGAKIMAWCILPTHYHVLASLDLDIARPVLGRLHNRTATAWNRQDHTPGRTVWYRFSDRRIRGEAHYFATVNYIHANPVRHKLALKADEWLASSLQMYLQEHGREQMVKLWAGYPVRDYGKGWDW